jgi:translocator protein
MVPAWLVVGIVTVLVGLAIRTSPEEFRWFLGLRRPRWLTFEWAIPYIWIVIFICGAWSAVLTWEASQSWALMAGYLLLEVFIQLYTLSICKLRSLNVGTVVGAAGFVIGLMLALQVLAVSRTAFNFLLPYLFWSPFGTFVTWKMSRIN